MIKKMLNLTLLILFTELMTGCASLMPVRYDYTAFKQSHPRSVVILPPLNESPDTDATYSMLSQVTLPLAESGYYVFPVTLVDETFKQNGLTTAHDINAVSLNKLREIFAADAALYLTVNRYGTTYTLINSVVTVKATARLVDIKSGATLWQGTASASDNEGDSNGGGDLVSLLIVAAVKQVINSVSETSHSIAGVTGKRLLSAGRFNGMLYGPYSAKYGTD